jgi:hypothetical protein
MCKNKIFPHPGYEVILEGAFDYLVQKIWCDKFVDVCARECICKWLDERVSYAASEKVKMTHNNIANHAIVLPQCF